MTSDPFQQGRQDPLQHSSALGDGGSPGPSQGSHREPPARKPLPVPLAPTAPRSARGPLRPGPRRADDRRIALVSIVVAAGYLIAALIAVVARALGADLVSPWLPLHLALAGGASTAIAGVMPFFVAALAAAPPAGARLRGGAVALVALGAGMVALHGVAGAATWAPTVGGTLYLAGIGAVALAVRASGRAGLMIRRPIVTLGYMLALLNVAIGALLGILAVAGWMPVLERWAQLKPAHAWTNVIGFVSLAIVATLLHFLPTVLGTRIIPRRSAAAAVVGVGLGSPLVVVGMMLGMAPVAAAGALLSVAGAFSMAVEATRVVRDRGRWTTDPGWHRFASLGLLAGVTWFLAGVVIAAGLVLARGATIDAWSTAAVGVPLAIGWIVQVLMASWTHLLPSIGPGGPPEHARQRRVLGRFATPRFVALNMGAVLLAIAWPAGASGLAVGGGMLVAGAIVVTVVLTGNAIRLAR